MPSNLTTMSSFYSI